MAAGVEGLATLGQDLRLLDPVLLMYSASLPERLSTRSIALRIQATMLFVAVKSKFVEADLELELTQS